MKPLTAADLPYQIHHTCTYREALDWGTEIIAREIAWREDCICSQDMAGIVLEFCERDIQVLEAARADLEAKYANIR